MTLTHVRGRVPGGWGVNLAQLTAVVADPDPAVTEHVAGELATRNVTVTTCRDGARALLAIGRVAPDVILLAAELPQVNTATVARAARAHLPQAPIVLGVGEGQSLAVREALEVSGTTCAGRPYRVQELLPVLTDRQVVHRAQETRPAVLSFADIELDSAAYAVRVAGRPLRLPLREFELLRLLLLNADRVVSRDDISRAVWGTTRDTKPVNPNTLNVHIARLRAHLGDDPANPRILRTHRGLGYRLTTPDAP
jgi:DNA-binding response OmpR family regulator